MSDTVYTTTINATVTIPITVTYTYQESDPGSHVAIPLPASVEVLSIALDEGAIQKSLDEENNFFEISAIILDEHESNLS